MILQAQIFKAFQFKLMGIGSTHSFRHLGKSQLQTPMHKQLQGTGKDLGSLISAATQSVPLCINRNSITIIKQGCSLLIQLNSN